MPELREPSDRPPDPAAFVPGLAEAPPGFWELFDRHRTALVTIAATLAAVFLAIALPLLGYRTNQAPHRLFKVVAVLGVLAFLAARPRTIPYLLCLALPFADWLPKSPIPFVNAANLLVFGSLIGVAILMLQGKVQGVVATPLDLPYLVFAIALLLSMIHGIFLWKSPDAPGPFVKLQGVWLIVEGFLAFPIVTHLVGDRKQVGRMIGWVMIGGFAAVLGPVREALEFGFGYRTPGGLGDINRMAAYLAIGGVFSLSMLAAYRGPKRVLIAVAALAQAIGLILPNSRGGYAGYLAAALPQSLRTSLVSTVLLLAVLGSSFFWAPSFVRERIVATYTAAEADDAATALDATSGGRITVWKAILKVVAEHPIAGVGFGNLIPATGLAAGVFKHAHNLYLQVAGEMGIVGLLLLLWLFYSCWRLGSRLIPRGGRPAALGRAYHGVILSLFVLNLFGQRFLDFSLAGLFFLITGIVAVEERLTRNDTSMEETG
ncbi:MAG: O-antigen ligase family protein [Candidatus Eisenbacteria bacterium]|nr:O-antigen ligase family protein [Candidatus Eisenbacteria bacterium]